MNALLFAVSAAVVVFAAVKLNRYGDVISQKSKLSGAVVGTFLIAGATSLPELTTSLTAVYIDNPDIAVGNMLGSNVFNVLILAAVDLIYRKHQMFNRIEKTDHMPAAIASILFTVVVATALFMSSTVSIFNVGIEMFILVGLYIATVKFFENKDKEEMDEAAATSDGISLKRANIGFAVSALVVFAAGSVLSISGDALAQQTGMSSSFVGSFLIAASTSLPELVTVLAAFKIGNYNMAAGSILGSNLFNLQLLAITDIFYQKAPILSTTSGGNLSVAILFMAMMVLIIFMMIRGRVEHFIKYGAPSLLIVLLYFVSSYYLF